MTLLAILFATLCAGIGSVWLAALLMRYGLGGRWRVGPQHLLSLAAGALLSTAFMHLLPEAFESGAEPHDLFATLLLGLVFFFVLEKAELWHHGHANAGASGAHEHHHGHGHSHDHSLEHGRSHAQGDAHHHHHHHHHHHGKGSWTLLTGDSVHCFGDGVLIASAFLADMRLGLIAAVSVLAHEVPHHMGDLIVMRRGNQRGVAMLKVSLAGSITALGGIAGYFLVGQLHDWLPFFLTVACSSFIYVALSDLIPQLQKHLTARQTLTQVLWLVLGIALVTTVSSLAHDLAHQGHDHDHAGGGHAPAHSIHADEH